jgi:hypothetical protein
LPHYPLSAQLPQAELRSAKLSYDPLRDIVAVAPVSRSFEAGVGVRWANPLKI